ncbi:MAG TPA: hypothetical protein VE326_03210 [Candidatus Binatia bacterium]|nr:hypothetical protein [Candidatus Binatia bacterium]
MIRWAALVLILLGFALIRFDLRDPGPVRRLTAGATATRYGLPLDVAGYVRLTAYFRGQAPADSMIPPYCYRPLVPLIASALPWGPLTSIDVVDLACLLLTLVLLDRLLFHVGYGMRGRTLGCFLFAASFPTFYYGAIGFVDPAALLALTGMALAALRGRRLSFAIWLVVGVLIKETNAIMAALPGVEPWARGTRGEALGRAAPLALLAVAIVVGIRMLAPFPEPGWLWRPSPVALLENLARPRALLSLVLTIGLPGAAAVAALATGRAARALSPEHLRFFLTGSALAAALYLYSLTAAYADGRVIWSVYPFLIPMAVAMWAPAAPGPASVRAPAVGA